MDNSQTTNDGVFIDLYASITMTNAPLHSMIIRIPFVLTVSENQKMISMLNKKELRQAIHTLIQDELRVASVAIEKKIFGS